VGLIVLVIGIGLGCGLGRISNLTTPVQAAGGVSGFFAALVAALWAYDGWNNVSMVSGEIRRPERYLPLALIFGTLVVVGLYLATNLAYFSVLSAAEVAGSSRVAATMMGRILGPFGAAAVSVAAMISIFAALNGSILSGARVPYAMARDGLFFPKVGLVHPQYHTPAVSILALSAWSCLLVLSGRYEQLFTYVIFCELDSVRHGHRIGGGAAAESGRTFLGPIERWDIPSHQYFSVLSHSACLISTLFQSPENPCWEWHSFCAGYPFIFIGVAAKAS